MDIRLINQLLCSTIKVDKRFKFYGNAEIFSLSVLTMIYNLIDCNSDIEHECLLKLQDIAQKMINKSPDICNFRGDSVVMTSNETILPILINLNSPPTIDDVGITFNDGSNTYTFNEDQFKVNFTDINGDLPETVRIVTLPATGTLQYNGVNIAAGHLFKIEDANKLTYIRVDNPYVDPFTFQTSDNNITNKLFSNMATFTITVDGQINQPPSEVGDGSETTAYATTIIFTRAMFTTATTPPYADPESDAAATLRIITLPTPGNIKLSGVNITALDEFDFTTEIDAGLLTYVPDSGTTTTHMPAFTFSIADAGSGIFVT